MAAIIPFSDEQARLLVNLRQRYEVWLDAEQALDALPYDLRKKTSSGRSYLYEISDRSGNGRSLGRWNGESEARLSDFKAEKEAARERIASTRSILNESSRLYRALRLPLLSSDAGPIVREADRRRLLGSHLLVIGTNAMAAYMIEAGGIIRDAPDETEDFDLAWTGNVLGESEKQVWDMLKSVDPTFTINSERDFQARNAKAYEVEILVAPSKAAYFGSRDKPRPVALPEQEWLLGGRLVDQVIGCRDGTPARIVAPDPRLFALHKLWMSVQPKRSALKRPKDRKQAVALLAAIDQAMPLYPLDKAFELELPKELKPLLQDWRDGKASAT